MSIQDWKYYNHAVISTLGPHEEPDLTCINNGDVWKIGGGYTTPCKMDNRL